MAQARPCTSSPRNPDDQLIYAIWNTLKPYAAGLRDLIMQSTTDDPRRVLAPATLKTEDPTPQYVVPHLTTRRAACTHLTTERLYGDFECNVCHRSSAFGWVYSCVQDKRQPSMAATDPTGDSSKAEEISDIFEPEQPQPPNSVRMVNEDLRVEDEEFRMPTTQLSPWIEKAIKEGHYTSEQVNFMRAQKQKVFETAKTAIERFQQSQISQKTGSISRNVSQSVDANPHLPFPVINEVEDATSETATQPKLRMFPHCDFRACQMCRPTFRDRTWQCFDHIFDLEMSVHVSSIQDDSRPLSSVSVMQEIGLREPPAERPSLSRAQGSGIYSLNETGRVVLQNNPYGRSKIGIPSSNQASVDTADSTDIADVELEEPESKGFRESMKRAFRSMLLTRRNSRKRKGKDSSESTSAEVDAATFDMGLWQELNDELLKEASSVPLPVKESIDTDGTNEEAGLIETDGLIEDDALLEGIDIAGAAVTEEAAETGTSAIIMSV